MENSVNHTNEELNLDAPWRIGEAYFNILVDKLTNIGAETFVEFGAGVSSIRLSQEFSDMSIYSIEHDIKYYNEALELKNKYVPDNPLNIYYRPLRWQFLNGRLYWTYENDTFPQSVDAVLIDGPPHWTIRGREACLYQMYDNINTNGLIFLDDYNRPGEEQALKNWRATYPDGLVTADPANSQKLCVLEKVSQTNRNKFSLRCLMDNLYQIGWHLSRYVVFRHPSQKGLISSVNNE